MTHAEQLQWWKEAKLGLFIHWGIYSLMGKGEWVMYAHRIPATEYRKLANKFNPTQFDAEQWVRFAKDAGMKYIVITAKHHDGFSMFRTKVSEYNIVDATPYKRDPMHELAEACRKEGIRLGFYYSHVREWNHPLAQSFEKKGRGDMYGNYGNFWDYPKEGLKDLNSYIDTFDMPQIQELLTQYGDVLTIWFDTPSHITAKQGTRIRQLVYDTQEGTLVNSRLSEDISVDYLTMVDDAIPPSGSDMPWESPMTTHNSWGYLHDAHYRSHTEMLRNIIDIASKGGNVLLNVGPDPDGKIPGPQRDAFLSIGAWMRRNGEAIYGTRAPHFPYQPRWGYVTRKGDSLYAILQDETAKSIALTGIDSEVQSCTVQDTGKALSFQSMRDRLEISLEGLVGEFPVIKITCSDGLRITEGIYPGDDGSINLPASLATVQHGNPYSKLEIRDGITEQWFHHEDSLVWEFKTVKAETFLPVVRWDAGGFWGLEDFGHQLQVELDGHSFACTVTDQYPAENGTRNIPTTEIELSPGLHRLELKAEQIVMKKQVGLRISGMQLLPQKKL